MDRKRKRCRDQQRRVWGEESGGWEYQKRSGEYGRACKVEDGHRDKTMQCPWYICDRDCSSCTEFFAGLGASGGTETERCDVVSFTSVCFSVRGEQHSSVCYVGYGQRKQAVQKGQNYSSREALHIQSEWGDPFHYNNNKISDYPILATLAPVLLTFVKHVWFCTSPRYEEWTVPNDVTGHGGSPDRNRGWIVIFAYSHVTQLLWGLWPDMTSLLNIKNDPWVTEVNCPPRSLLYEIRFR